MLGSSTGRTCCLGSVPPSGAEPRERDVRHSEGRVSVAVLLSHQKTVQSDEIPREIDVHVLQPRGTVQVVYEVLNTGICDMVVAHPKSELSQTGTLNDVAQIVDVKDGKHDAVHIGPRATSRRSHSLRFSMSTSMEVDRQRDPKI